MDLKPREKKERKKKLKENILWHIKLSAESSQSREGRKKKFRGKDYEIWKALSDKCDEMKQKEWDFN